MKAKNTLETSEDENYTHFECSFTAPEFTPPVPTPTVATFAFGKLDTGKPIAAEVIKAHPTTNIFG